MSYVTCLNRFKFKKARKGCKCISNTSVIHTYQVDPRNINALLSTTKGKRELFKVWIPFC